MYQICILFSALHKLNITLENLILDFLVGTSQLCFSYYTYVCKSMLK